MAVRSLQTDIDELGKLRDQVAAAARTLRRFVLTGVFVAPPVKRGWFQRANGAWADIDSSGVRFGFDRQRVSGPWEIQRRRIKALCDANDAEAAWERYLAEAAAKRSRRP